MAITTNKVRASYVNIFQPRVPENGGDPKYSVTLLIPKSDTATINAIYAEIEKAKQEGAQKVFNGNIPPMCKIPIYDGDGYRANGELFGEECKGCMVMTASAKMQPIIVNTDMQNIINPAEVYSGCYIRANINFFAYNSNGNKGIGCGLNCVQKIEDGEPLTARVSAEEAFGGANTYTGANMAMPSTPGIAMGYPAPPQMQNYQMPQQAPVPMQGYQTPQQAPLPMQSYQTPVQQPPYQQTQQIDPITGRPLLSGGIMGLQ